MGFLQTLLGDSNKKSLRKIEPLVEAILALEPEYAALSDDELRGKTEEFKARLKNGETTDDILVPAFATIREGAWRAIGKKHFRVQLIGGILLHQGRIAEMKTGEGKTLVATLPAYLNALTGEGVHVVTVNDYLARFHSEWMGNVFRFLGLSVGLIVNGLNPEERREAYAADITYGTNNEFGFDYLRDNMAIYKSGMVQRGHAYAIVDEVDSILIDEARTPLIISGVAEASTDLYTEADRFVAGLRCQRFKELESKGDQDSINADYVVDEKARSVSLTASGTEKAEKFFKLENLSDPENSEIVHHIQQAMRARGIMHRDINYVVKDGKILIVDEFTGRIMMGRRYSEGLHQAIEAKEKVEVQNESKTQATITLQNYFRMYKKLAGMTGTAKTEENEFRQIYGLDVIEVPTNLPMIREDMDDSVYKTVAGKDRAIIAQIRECHEKGQPVLVGTISIEKSEHLSALLRKTGIPHQVLNAKHHEREAEIVAQAGKFGAVTIATNMAGRGTDILLGGNPEFMAKNDLRKEGYDHALIAECDGHAPTEDIEILDIRKKYADLVEKHATITRAEAEKVRAAGGLYIIGTERHESRRIDNQLRGRAGRQGDPGASRFFISLQDDLMRLFGSERIMGMMDSLGLDEDTPIDNKLLTNAIETAQKNLEAKNFGIRKHVLEYDDVMNVQRDLIYKQRMSVLDGEDVRPSIDKMVESVAARITGEAFGSKDYMDPEDLRRLRELAEPIYAPEGTFDLSMEELEDISPDGCRNILCDHIRARMDARSKELGDEKMREIERIILLRAVDLNWMNHIDAMQDLRSSIGLRAYGNDDPVVAYKHEGFDMFEAMVDDIREQTVRHLLTFRIDTSDTMERRRVSRETSASQSDGQPAKKPAAQPIRKQKIGVNDPCPCGSGKKYKKCCGMNPNVR
ncbi:MAG: preprotein translocase subunit SecA [Clostridia bacterium]|nr:preprotein translocase subunit SecA [Clostridia bacterium]